ncbi:microtubule-associated protein futsch-like [Sitophilus oryzae]|uniref:Microtubule-associated protein futsch-like n=1 Tax=Sitophilus oryzae TaxID=7048 RepID=A0A6J2YUA0_SITOR|nr:microtubule-associated protein futsch-like [Sitophilus oryzae]XP_030766757.1 microtubule-associated protein futsch-like [Sitophilus oryzae]XP_030766758.1 microtubule-associated protein futsch-like [Sitophilus oryzae]
MPRRTPTAELQASEASVSSPLRRSSRISSNTTAHSSTPTAIVTRRNSQTEAENNAPAKITRSRRSSATDVEEKIETKPLTRTRRASLLAENESKPDAKSTPTRRERRGSVTETTESKPEEKPKPVRSRRSSASDQPTQPEKKPQTRGRRRSVDVEMETQESSQPPKPTTRRKRSPESENQNGEVNTEKETRPRRSRRVSTDGEVKSNTSSNSRSEKEDARSMSKSPQVVDTTLEEKNDEDLSPILMQNVTIKLTPIKKTRLLDKVEAELDLSVINESVDDINTSKLDNSDSKVNANEDTGHSEKDAQHRNKSTSPKNNVSKKRPSTSPDGNRTPRKSPRLMSKESKDVTPSKDLKHSKKLSFSENITVISHQDNKVKSEEEKLLNLSGESSGSNKENVDVTTTGAQSITDSVLNSSEFKLQSDLHCEPCEPMDVDLSASEIAILENKQKDGKEDTDSIENYIIEETGNSVNISMKPKAKDSNFTRVFEKEIGNKESEILDNSLTEISIRHVTISTSLIQPRKESTSLSKSTSPIPGESYEEVVGLKQPDLQTTSTTLQNYSPEKQTTNKLFNSEAVTTNMSVEKNVSERKELDLSLSPQKKVLDENITLQTEISKPITNLKHHLLNSAVLANQVEQQDFEKSLSENNKPEISFNDSISSKEVTDNKEKDVECTEDIIRTRDIDELENSKNTLEFNQKKNETDGTSSSTTEVSTSSLQHIETQDKQEQEFPINQSANEDLNIANKSIEKFSSSNASPKIQSPSISGSKKVSLHNSDIQNSPKISERNTVSAKTNESVPSESKESDLTHYDFNLPSEDDDVFANDSKLNDGTKELSDEENEANDTRSRQEVSINKENSEDPNSDEQARRSENDNNTNLELEKSDKLTSSDSDGVITPDDLVNEDKGIEKIKSDKQVIGSESDIIDKNDSVQNTLNENLEIQGFEKEKSDKRIVTSEDDNSVLQEFKIRTKESTIEKDGSVKNILNENMEVITTENTADEDKINNKSIIPESDTSINEDLDKSTDNACKQKSVNDDLPVKPENKTVKPENKTDEVAFSVREASRGDDSKKNVSNSEESNLVITKPDNTKENDTLGNDSDYSDEEVKENNPKTSSPVSDSSKTPTLNIIENIVIHKGTEEPENEEANIPVKDEKEQTTTPSQHVQSVSDGKENKSKKSSLQAFDNKLDSYIKSQLDADSSSDEEKVEVNDFIDDMAEEGEEDTPSEDSNQIIDEGESVGFSESDERSSEDEYEHDSFICDDEEGNELLPGNEYDLDEPNQVKKSRIISPSNLPDDEIIQIHGKKKEPVKRKSRIIRVSSSSSDEGNAEVFETKNVPNKRIEQLKKTESVRSTSSGSSVIILDSSVNESSKTVTTEDSQLVSDSADEKQPIGEEVEQQTPAKKSTETPVKADKSLQSRPRKSSLTIQENIIVDGSVDLRISRRINSLVDSFCSSVSKGEIAVNISLEYEDTKNDNLPKETEVKNAEEDSIILSSQTNSDSDDLHDVETPERKPQSSTSLDNVQDLRDVLNEKVRKRRLSKSLDDLTKNTKPNKKRKLVKKAKKEKKPKKKQSENQTRDPIASSFSLVNQLITDVKNRPRRKIKPSQSNADVVTSWNASAIEDLKPSTSPASKKEKMKPSTLGFHQGFHPKDFRNRMLAENSRVNRINTKTLLKKKGAFS